MIVGILLIGMVLMASALKGTESELAQQLQIDFLGKQGFIVWLLAIVAIGAIGYVPGLTKTSRYLLLLVAVVIVLQNKGLFAQFQLAIQQASSQGPAPTIAPPEATSGSNKSSGDTSGDTSGGASDGKKSDTQKGIQAAGTAIQVAEIAAMFL